MHREEHTALKTTYFWTPLVICFIYLLSQCLYISYAAFSMDDFWLAYHTNQFRFELPYRDFLPYKTVLGYYVFFIPLYFVHGVLTPLIYTKVWIALINSFFLMACSVWLQKFFSPKAVLITLTLILCTPLFTFFSTEIRVDLLAYWMCLMSVLFLFNRSVISAGCCIGLAFVICQKAVWYLVATNCGLLGCWILQERSWSRIKEIIHFNGAAFFVLLTYLVFWSCYSNVHTVLSSVFYEPYVLINIRWYEQLVPYYWHFIMGNSIELVLLTPLALIGLIIFPERKHCFIIIYSLVILFFLVSCKQPFTYFALGAIPMLFVLLCAFFSILFIHPVKNINPWLVRILFIIGIVIGIVIPITRTIQSLPLYDGRYQRAMVHLSASLLTDTKDSYIAGVPLLLDKKQTIPGLMHLAGPGLDYLRCPNKELYNILTLSSLYFSPTTVPEIIQSIEAKPIKFYVDNSRFHYLPPQLFHYLDTQYQHYWGSIYLYAPQILAGQQQIRIKFPGTYQVLAKTAVVLNYKTLKPNSLIHLEQQTYASNATDAYRLRFVPDHSKELLDPRDKDNDWQNMLLRSN